MVQVILKAVMWNPEGYVGPAGFPTRGYPEENGFGHEEWNNSPRMRYREGGTAMRAFHTEAIWKPDDPAAKNETIVVMYASHDGKHELVGIAARAKFVLNETERASLAERLKISSFAESAWRQPAVKAAHGASRREFDVRWERDHCWIPNWTCPAAFFFQPRSRVILDPWRIRNTSKLLTMFGRYTAVDAATGMRVLLSVPHPIRDANWERIAETVGGEVTGPEAAADDTGDVQNDGTLPPTTKQALIAARLGQGRFRRQVALRWENRCSVTGCTQQEVLRASHIKPWWGSTSDERLDPANGLILCAHLDALFDRYLISFRDDGRMLVSPRVEANARELLGLPASLRRQLGEDELTYMQHHRLRFENA